jgi:hypothetical protein
MFVSLTWYYSLADRHAEAVNVGQQAVKAVAEQLYGAHEFMPRLQRHETISAGDFGVQ